MPRRDKTGPDGMGPSTGRGRGGCSASGVAKEIGKRVDDVFYGRGRGRGNGLGRRRRLRDI